MESEIADTSTAKGVFSDLTGFHEEGDHTYWLSRKANASIHLHDRNLGATLIEQTLELSLTFTAGSRELYDYFPFLTKIFVQDVCIEILEFSYPEESQEVKAPLDDSLKLTVLCEQGCVPKKKNISQDERELALHMTWDLHVRDEQQARYKQSRNIPSLAWPDSRLLYSQHERLARPIFVVGAYRSGTSILTWALGQHPNIFPLEETGFFGFMSHGLYAGLDLAGQAKRSFLDVYEVSAEEFMASAGQSFDDLLQRIARRQQERVLLQRLSGQGYEYHPDFSLSRSLWAEKNRWVDGTPENIGCVPLLRKLFPQAQFIFLFRHPVDVIASLQTMQRTGGHNFSLEKAFDFWIKMTEQGFTIARAYGSHVVKPVHFAELVQSPGDTLDQLFEFLHEPRFRKSALCFGTKINTSSVLVHERDRSARMLYETKQYPEALDLYNRCIKLANLPIVNPDSGYQDILNDQVNDFQTQMFYLLED